MRDIRISISLHKIFALARSAQPVIVTHKHTL